MVGSDIVTPKHIDTLMNTDRVVVRYYRGKKLLSKVDYTPKTLKEYLNHFILVLKLGKKL